MNTFALTLTLLLAKDSLSASIKLLPRDPELLPHLFQGDLVNRPGRTYSPRNVITNAIYHWPNRTVLYVIEEGTFEYILRSMQRIEKISCVRFVEAEKPSDHKYFVNLTSDEDGCYCEDIGWRNQRLKVNLAINDLDNGCFRMGSIIHELLHVLGFEHQHVAHNRDEYVRIVWDNISPEHKINFVNDETEIGWNNYGVEYDYGSVMHYIQNAFAKNESQPTIVALKEGGSKMGQRKGLSKKDVRKLNIMYKCPGYV
ncbi:seminal metalloprotease 1 [Drosophila obscura]|uniref:seminal metalloprotease 1 n=1 Tax=Drosophila obscura TaxID=7282 RepID=UPI000B9FEF6E|nr:seminal metalloprotease 1 [Drosophila obscura]